MKAKKTPKQLADLQIKCTGLLFLIQRWREVQVKYMPGLANIIQPPSSASANDIDTLDTAAVEEFPLWLPSSLVPSLRVLSPILDIAIKETRLRIAQAEDSLAEIRRYRRIVTGLYQFKRLNVSGTGNKPNTRMRTLFNRFNHRTLRSAERYRAAYTALLLLDPAGSWSIRFKKLDPKDISGPGKEDDDPSNGRFVPSWIWLVPRASGDADMESQLNDSLRVEWMKSKARVQRWEEEVELVHEEMRRVVEYSKWKATWWRAQGTRGVVTDRAVVSGLAGYAEKQAVLMEQLAVSCAQTWLPALLQGGILPPWGESYITSEVGSVRATSRTLNGEGPNVNDSVPVDTVSSAREDWDDEEEDEDDEEVDDDLDTENMADDTCLDFFEDDD